MPVSEPDGLKRYTFRHLPFLIEVSSCVPDLQCTYQKLDGEYLFATRIMAMVESDSVGYTAYIADG